MYIKAVDKKTHQTFFNIFSIKLSKEYLYISPTTTDSCDSFPRKPCIRIEHVLQYQSLLDSLFSWQLLQ